MKEELVIHNKPKSNISEDIRTIRTNLMFTSSDEESQVILVTSSIPGEGKSFISSNLATAFAQTDETTLLIDCDLRLGRIHKIFGVSNDKGFSNLLASQSVVNCADFIKKTPIPNLYVIPRGTVPPNPSELLNSTNTKRVINFLRENFSRIIFDGVPINGLPDSLIMALLVDRVVLVTAVGYTKIDELMEAKKALEKIDANIAGVVVNRVNQTKRGKYSNYYE
ncbi:MAG: CpsD/CapB family tyrosine-protein kinase [Bacilli bacterium]|nr:CpsD/CapB family tyrosine-protein kinase [Clostridium sp.]MDY3798660.1 CpsD/CapB family tyrosine-protein kinase [Bacilli bacterium]CDE95158.1 tyrosine-protein kinase EpsD [Clostridium sp. CAG:914]